MSRLLLCWYLHSSIVYFSFALRLSSSSSSFLFEAHWFTETSSSWSSAEQKTAIRYRQPMPYDCNGTAPKQKTVQSFTICCFNASQVVRFQIVSTRVTGAVIVPVSLSNYLLVSFFPSSICPFSRVNGRSNCRKFWLRKNAIQIQIHQNEYSICWMHSSLCGICALHCMPRTGQHAQKVLYSNQSKKHFTPHHFPFITVFDAAEIQYFKSFSTSKHTLLNNNNSNKQNEIETNR